MGSKYEQASFVELYELTSNENLLRSEGTASLALQHVWPAILPKAEEEKILSLCSWFTALNYYGKRRSGHSAICMSTVCNNATTKVTEQLGIAGLEFVDFTIITFDFLQKHYSKKTLGTSSNNPNGPESGTAHGPGYAAELMKTNTSGPDLCRR